MSERNFITFTPIPAPNGLLVTVAATNIIALKKDNSKYWIIMDSGNEYEINLATYTLLKSQIDTNP